MGGGLECNILFPFKNRTICKDDYDFAIIMLIYNHLPDISSLSIGAKYAKKIILIDNNSNSEIKIGLKNIAEILGDKCSILQNSVNKGVSKAYNEAVANLDTDINYVLLLDHDAIFNSELFEQIFIAIEENKSKKWGVIVPIVADERSLMGSNIGIREKYSILNSTITSGIFISRALFLKFDGFDENIFVEGSDYELTNRIRESGYFLIRINRILIVQEFEQPIFGDRFLIKMANSVIKYRSLIRIKINNCNIFRTKLSFYNESRKTELFENLKKLRKGTMYNRIMISVVILLNKIEMVIVKLIKNLDKEIGVNK